MDVSADTLPLQNLPHCGNTGLQHWTDAAVRNAELPPYGPIRFAIQNIPAQHPAEPFILLAHLSDRVVNGTGKVVADLR